MAEFQLRVRGRVIETFTSDTDPGDADECVALLKRRARDRRVTPRDAVLRTWVGKHRTPRDYRV